MCTSTIGLNNRLAPFDDVRVRQALNYALDKERLIETFSGGNALVAEGSLPPGMPGYGGLEGVSYPYDPEKARQLLADAGYRDPAEIDISEWENREEEGILLVRNAGEVLYKFSRATNAL